MKYRILLADDHVMFRQALRMCLERYPDLEIVGEVADGDAVLAAALLHAPDVVCMDFCMPKLNGVEATRELLAARPQTKIICLSAHIDLPLVVKMMRAGALGFVDKVQAASELHPAIQTVGKNQLYFSPKLGIQDAAVFAAHLNQADEK